jgi:hypothetical protein
MVNQIWDDFQQCIDDSVEMIPPHKQDAHKNVSNAKEMLEMAAMKKKEVEKTINIDNGEKNAEIKVFKSQM